MEGWPLEWGGQGRCPVQRGGVEDDKVCSLRDRAEAELLMETGKSGGGAGLGPGDDEHIFRHADPDLLIVGYFS